MFKFAITIVAIFTLSGCSNVSTNQVSKGVFVLRDGYFRGRFQVAQLPFKRFSWFKEANLIYDVRIANIAEKSPYFHWFSQQTQQDIRECPRFYLALFYAKSPKYISHRSVEVQLEAQGAQLLSIPTFWHSLKMHPAFERQALKAYRARGICFNQSPPAIILGLPGYPYQVILD